MKYMIILFVVMLLMYITMTPDWLCRSGEKKKEGISDIVKSESNIRCDCRCRCNDCEECPDKKVCYFSSCR